MDEFKIGKGVKQGCMLSPCLFNLYAEYIMWNARLDESQAGIRTARRNINNLRYADDTTLMKESEVELKSLLMRVKEESEKAGLKLNIEKHKIMPPVPSVQFSCSVVSNFLRPHESQHARPPCPLQTPRVYPNHVHQVSHAFQPSHPLSSPSPASVPSQHQSLFQWVNSSHEVAKVLEFQL